ncbi:hypothetical protein Tco_0400415 [Tanacetum coccineum]
MKTYIVFSIIVPTDLPVAPEVGSADVASPAGVLELDIHSLSESGPSRGSLLHVPVAPMVSPFLCMDDPESDIQMPEWHVSSSPTSTSETPTAPILPAPPTFVAPSTDIISPIVHHRMIYLQTVLQQVILYLGILHQLPPLLIDLHHQDSFIHRLLGLQGVARPMAVLRSPTATGTLPIPAVGLLVPTHADLLPPYKRFGDSYSLENSIKEDIDAYVLADIDIDAGVDSGIGMEVGVKVVRESGEEYEAESSAKGTVEIGMDRDLYDHMREIPIDRITGIEVGQRQLEADSLIASRERASLLHHVATLERNNVRLRGTLMMESARVDRF